MIDISEDNQARSRVRINVDRCKNALNLLDTDVRAADIGWEVSQPSLSADIIRNAETALRYLTEIINTIKGK